MDKIKQRSILIGVACLGLGFVATVAFVPMKDSGYTVTEREFICEDDGKLVERHVGVLRVTRYNQMYTITYDDNTTAYYHQPSGETCKIEEYVPNPPSTACAINNIPVDCDTFLRTKWGGA